MVKIDMSNQRIGNLTVISEVKNDTEKVKWLCKCDCGNTCVVNTDRLRSGKKTHCGCKGYDKTGSLVGKRIGRLTVVSYYGAKNKKRLWNCVCDCGNSTILSTAAINQGKTRSCGCLIHESGISRTKYKGDDRILYFRWNNILSRCTNYNDPAYKNYGGRGIRVCDEWKNDFWAFRNWAVNNGFKPELSIDRINNNGNYEPDNCRWTTPMEQANNRRSNRVIAINGENKSLAEWCREYDIRYGLVQDRLYDGWDIKRALTTPPRLMNIDRTTAKS